MTNHQDIFYDNNKTNMSLKVLHNDKNEIRLSDYKNDKEDI